MSRQVRMALLTCFGLGISAATVDAQSPSAWDPVFSSVSYRPYSVYYTGYSGYYGIPYSTSYAPGCGCSQVSYAGSSCAGCSSCVGCSSVSGCASGNCASGNCSTTANLAPDLAPVADPANQSTYSSKSLENRLQHIERYLETNQNFRPVPQDNFRGTNRGDRFNDIQTRPRQPASGIGDPDTTYQDPINGGNNDDGTMFKGRSNERNSIRTDKVNTEKPESEAKKDSTKTNKKGPAPMSPPDGSMRILDTQVTSRAVAPKERLSFQNSDSRIASTRKTKPVKLEVDARSHSIDLARQ